MGGGGQQVVGKHLEALLAGGMEIAGRRTELFAIEAHIVARQQHAASIERGVFHGFGRGG
ncbi:hypothetical protein D3C80_2138660 [compost metagenome]